MSKSYQELRERMDQWEAIPADGLSYYYDVRIRELEALMRDMLDVALSEKKS